MSVAIVEEIEDARNVLATSDLTDEAKEGLLATLQSLTSIFSLGGLNNAIQSSIPAIDSAITNFAIVSSLAGSAFPEDAKDEIRSLVDDILELRDSAEVAALDASLKEALVRQLNALVALLYNAEAVGVDSALSAYLDLCVRMRREHSVEAADKTEKSGLWAKISSWGERLVKVSDMVDAGSKLAPLLEKAPDLLKLLG